jgi:hypothetical protein
MLNLKNTLIALVLIVLLAGIGYWASLSNRSATNPLANDQTIIESPITTETPIVVTDISDASWQTFSDPKLGFSIRYPKLLYGTKTWKADITKDWTIDGYGVKDDVIFGFLGEGDIVPGWSVQVWHDVSLQNRLINELGNQFDQAQKTQQLVTLNGRPGTLVKVSVPADNWETQAVLIQANDRLYVIDGSAAGGNLGSDFKKFYSSFKIV